MINKGDDQNKRWIIVGKTYLFKLFLKIIVMHINIFSLHLKILSHKSLSAMVKVIQIMLCLGVALRALLLKCWLSFMMWSTFYTFLKLNFFKYKTRKLNKKYCKVLFPPDINDSEENPGYCLMATVT